MLEGSELDQQSGSNESCPLGAHNCWIFSEVERLRQECRTLKEISQTDPLTGLFNYRYLIAALDREMERTRRTGLSTGLIMIDLDHFKKINDTYGHESGNEAIQWAGNIWRKNLRRFDIPCRYGGEEFAVVLPGIRLSQAIRTAERLRSNLTVSPANLDGQEVSLTASFGVDIFNVRETLNIEDFIKRADRYLRDAKRKGRNRVCHKDVKASKDSSGVSGEERDALFATRWTR